MSRLIYGLLLLVLLFSVSVVGTVEGRAATNEPALPKPIAQLKDEGAQMKYLGRDLGFDGWIAVKDGQEQYFYVTPDGSAFFLGVLFNKNGRAITYDQMKRLQGKKDPVFDDLMNAPSQKSSVAMADMPTPAAAPTASGASLSEQLMGDVVGGSAFIMGLANAPVVYMFVDPLCPHCKEMLKTLKPAVDAGKLRINVLMVGALHPESRPLAVGVLGAPDPSAALVSLMNGDIRAVKPGADAPDPRLDRNLSILQKWKFDGTPVTVYRGRDGTVKLVQGAVAKPEAILNDLP